jgi:hypothetical protein
MNTSLTAVIVCGCLFGAVLLGMWLRRLLPTHHLSADTKDTVKLAMGLVATMTALLVGLLISSAKNSYDSVRGEVMQMAARVVLLDRVLGLYGPDAAETRTAFRATVEAAIRHVWPDEKGGLTRLPDNPQAGAAIYFSIQRLSPRDDAQRSLKTQAESLAMELARLQSMLMTESVTSISKPLLVMVISWLVLIFLSFSLVAPSNPTATVSLLVSAFAITCAVYLILELDRPFGGLVQISSQPMLNALNQLGK